MIAARELLGLKPAGGVYVPLAGDDRRPRGLVSDELRDELGTDFVENDFQSPEQVEEHLRAASETACELVRPRARGRRAPVPRHLQVVERRLPAPDDLPPRGMSVHVHSRAAARDRVARAVAVPARQRGQRQDLGAGRALRARGARGRRGGGPRSSRSRSPRRPRPSSSSASAGASSTLGRARAGARGRGRVDQHDPRLLLAPAACPSAVGRDRPRVPRARPAGDRARGDRRVRARARGVPRVGRGGGTPRRDSSCSPTTRPRSSSGWCAPCTRICAAAASCDPALPQLPDVAPGGARGERSSRRRCARRAPAWQARAA